MAEPNVVLRWAMYHFAGGDAFLCGLLGFGICQLALLNVQGRCRQCLIIGSRLGLIWAAADPPPVNWLLFVVFVAMLVSWRISQWRSRQSADSADAKLIARRERIFQVCAAGIALIGILSELPYLWFRSPVSTVKTLCVVGDSITAGLNDGEDTWPKQLARQVDARILDASQPGATLKSALGQVELLNSQFGDVLLLEIGGNDLLEGLPLAEFEQNLDRLLALSQQPERQAVMFELPLPPLAMRYVAIQRRLARQYHVRLIPRRQFLSVLTKQGSTVDGIHLSAAGHSRMADLVQQLLKFPTVGPTSLDAYRHFEPKRITAR